MTQTTPIIGSGQSGTAYRTADNNGKQALLNHHKGSSAPSYAEAGVLWLDDSATPWHLKIYDGADWIAICDINASANTVAPYQGAGALRYLGNASDTGATNAYAVAPAPAATAYAAGQVVTLKPGNANTGASTLAVSGMAAKNIKMPAGGDPPAGALLTTGIYILVYDGANFVLTNPSSAAALSYRGAVAYNSANQTIVSGIAAALTFNSETIDTDSLHSTSSSTSRMTVPPGVSTVRLFGQVSCPDTGSTTPREIIVYKNGAAMTAGAMPQTQATTSTPSSGTTILQVHSPALAVTTGDYFELYFYQASLSSLSINAGYTWFEMQILG